MNKYKIVRRWSPILREWKFDARDEFNNDLLWGFTSVEDCEEAMKSYNDGDHMETVVKEVEL